MSETWFNFTFAGNIGKVQNLDNVVRGFGLFVKDNPAACLNIIGDGSYLDELKELVRNENIQNVNFAGRKPLSEMSGYYAASDVLIISLKNVPLYEIMISSKFQAYLMTRKPIYTIMGGEVRRMVEQYGIGFGSHPDNIEEIARGFSRFPGLSGAKKERMSQSAAKLGRVFDRQQIIEKIDRYVWDRYE